jgi:tol-pal system protein YbgF
MKLTNVMAMRPRAALGATLGLLILASLPAHAQLFKDEELYKRASQLEAQRAADQKRTDQIESRVDARAEQQGKVLIDLTQQIESLKGEIAKLRGQIEVLANDIENAQKRQKDFYTDLDARVRKLEPPPAPTPGQPPKPPTPEEQKAYEAGLNLVKTSNFRGAIDAFGGFLRTYPNSQLAPSAQYWIGNSQFALRDYKAAITAQQRVVEVWPEDAKAPDALLNISSAYTELKDVKSARATIEDLIKRYPQSDAAKTGAERIKRLR